MFTLKSRVHHRASDGNDFTIENRLLPDGTTTSVRLDGVKLLEQVKQKQYYSGSRYEGNIYLISRFSDGVEIKTYLRSFDEWPGSWD